MPKLTCSKLYTDFPFAHRQPNHDGHCALIHGHNWSFEFTFACDTLEPGTGFVVDFGKLKWLKEWLSYTFDHTLVLNDQDPALDHLRLALRNAMGRPHQLAKIIAVPDCSCEGLAIYLLHQVNRLLPGPDAGRGLRVVRVTVFEDSKNSATAEL